MEGCVFKIGQWRYMASNGLGEEMAPRLFDAAALKAGGAKECGGRGQALSFSLGGRGCFLRHYLRGGLWGRVMGGRFASFMPRAHQAFDEFSLLSWMRSEGLPVPQPVAARETGCAFIRQDIVVGRIEALDLSVVIARRLLTQEELSRLGMTIGRFFDAGIMHTDLNIRNILLSESGDFYLIDFDKCFRTEMDSGKRQAVLDRLRRSFLKEIHRTTGKAHYNDTDFALIESKAMHHAGTV